MLTHQSGINKESILTDRQFVNSLKIASILPKH